MTRVLLDKTPETLRSSGHKPGNQVLEKKPTPGEIALVQLVIDEQREGLDPIDKAQGYVDALEATGLNASQLAAKIGVSHTTVGRNISLLALPEDLKTEIRKGDLAVAIARELVRVEGEDAQRKVLVHIREQGMNTKQAEKYISNLLNPKAKPPGRPKAKGKHIFKVSGFEATVTPKKLTLIPIPTANGKPRTPEQMLAALKLLTQKFEDQIAKDAAKDQAAAPQPAEATL